MNFSPTPVDSYAFRISFLASLYLLVVYRSVNPESDAFQLPDGPAVINFHESWQNSSFSFRFTLIRMRRGFVYSGNYECKCFRLLYRDPTRRCNDRSARLEMRANTGRYFIINALS